jgi:hypothetical protein
VPRRRIIVLGVEKGGEEEQDLEHEQPTQRGDDLTVLKYLAVVVLALRWAQSVWLAGFTVLLASLDLWLGGVGERGS